MRKIGIVWVAAASAALALMVLAAPAAAQEKKPNILVLWGDDIGQFNISAYNMGMMGYKTPNIDRIAQEGAIFTDWYGQQSCTAGRAAFITGQSPIRTGLTKVGLPGAKEGLTTADPTLAELIKPRGYTTGQFGKNHLGDRNEMLPTVHGFDEWLGNLYHLNAEEEPENVDYPKDPAFRAKFGPRGVLHCFATDKDDVTDDPRFGKMGKQKCEDTGPLTRKRMETIDDEVTAGAITFMDKAARADKPFFIWWNSSRMHTYTHLSPKWEGKSGLGIEADGMLEHDSDVGLLLDELKKLGIENNTIVMYSSDNGAEFFLWPDGGTTIFRGEKNTQWEGGYRVPCMIRWPGVVKPGTIINDIGAHEDMVPTVLAAAGDPTVKEDLLKGKKIGDMTYKVHLDGYNLMPFLKGEVAAVSASRVHLLDRRRECGGGTLRQLEDDLPAAKLRWIQGLGNPVRGTALADADQSAHGPARARFYRIHQLHRLGRTSDVHAGPRRRLRRAVAAELPRIPAAHEAGQLQPRPRHGGDDQPARQRQVTRRWSTQ